MAHMDGPTTRAEIQRLLIAIDLMRSALKILDSAGAGMPALHLQHAISLAEGEPATPAGRAGEIIRYH